MSYCRGRSGRRLHAIVLVLMTIAATAFPARGQSIVDGVTFGAGVSMYRGDLDHNPDDSLIRFLASSTPHALVALDRRVGPLVLEGGFSYDRLHMLHTVVDGRLHMLSMDATIALPLALPARFASRVYVGVAPALQKGTYRSINAAWMERTSYEPIDTRVVLTFPMGIVFQDAVRLGIRLAARDDFDGYRGRGVTDAVVYVSVTHRFNLLD